MFSEMSPQRQRGARNFSTEAARIFQTLDVLFHVLLQMTSLSRGVSTLLTSKHTIRFQFLVQCFNLANYFLWYYWFHFVSQSSSVRSLLDVICLSKFGFSYLEAACFTQFRLYLRIFVRVLSVIEYYWFLVLKCCIQI